MQRPQRHDGVVQFSDCTRHQGIEAPTTVAPIADQPGLLEHPEMEGEPRLCRVEIDAEITDATFAVPQRLDDSEPGLIREGVGQCRGAGSRGCRSGHHPGTLINIC